MKRVLIITLIWVCGTVLQAQELNPDLNDFWKEVYLLESQGKLKSAQAKVDSIKQLEQFSNLTMTQVRTYLYHAKFRLLLEEDASLAVILELDSLINKETEPKFFYHYLRAKSLNDYRNYNRYEIRNNGEIDKDTSDIRFWSNAQFLEKIDSDYSNAFELGQNVRIEEYVQLIKSGAENESYNFDLIDLMGQEMIKFYGNDGKYLPKIDKSILQWENFRAYDFSSLNHYKKKKLNTLKLLEARARQNGKKSIASFYALERVKLFKYSLSVFPIDEWANEIEGLLEDNALDEAPIQLTLAKHYYDRLNNRNNKNTEVGVLAHKWASTIVAEDSTNFESIEAAKIIFSLEEQDVVLEMKGFEPTQTSAKIHLQFKNLNQVQFRLYRSSPEQINFINEFQAPLKNKLAEQQLVRSWSIKLPQANDYRHHSTETLLQPLAHGTYVIAVFSPETDEVLTHTNFQVTDLNFMEVRNEGKQEMLITHRISGKALRGVQVIFEDDQLRGTYKSDRNGKIYLPAKNFLYDLNPILIYNEDTTYFNRFSISNNYGRHPDKLNIQVNMLTDRSIYRPGQTMYFKGYVHSYSNAKKKVAAGEEVYITLYDSDDEEILEKLYITNEFGTFSDSLTLPKNALTGPYYFEIEEGDEDSDLYDEIDDFLTPYVYFEVEEYKRPRFEIESLLIKEAYTIGDSIALTQKAHLFSGGNLSGAHVSYTVHALNDQQLISEGELRVDDNGEFKVSFLATSQNELDTSALPVLRYRLAGIVTDQTGESREFSRSVSAGFQKTYSPILFENEVYRSDGKAQLSITTKNLNNEAFAMAGELKVYKLPEVETYPIRRLWEAPEFNTISEDSFKMIFPYEAYSEIEMEVSKELIASFLKHKDSTNIELPIDKWNRGRYQLEFIADEQFPQTSSVTFEVLENNRDRLDKTFLNVYSNQNAYEVGDKASITFETDVKDITVYVFPDQFAHRKPDFVFKLSENKHSITLPVKKQELGGYNIHYVAIGHNYASSGTQRIDVPVIEEPIQIKTQTFRDLIEPGQEETWKFTISEESKKGLSAELVANMYDASLDEFTPHQWNFNNQFIQKYSVSNIDINDYLFKTARSGFINYSRIWFNGRINPRFNLFGFSLINAELSQSKYLAEMLQKLKPNVDVTFDKEIPAGSIMGRVTDELGEPLPRVTILKKGTSTGVPSNADGTFTLNAKPGDYLVVRYLGYITMELRVNNGNYYEVNLIPDMQSLGEVVVSGYGVEQKRELTFGVSMEEEIEEELDLPMILQGRVPGAQFQIRGNSSLATNTPLFIVDGVPLSGGLIDLKPENIEGISVLKGPEATALYGAQAANGVVIITTKASVSKVEALLDGVKARSNLSESAFFFPHLTTDKEGNVSFSFKSPEALTRWKLMLLAHTKDVLVKEMTRYVTTQKKLMVSPNWPRFLRAGDKVDLSAKIINLTDSTLNTQIRLQIIDPETEALVSSIPIENSTLSKTVGAKSNANAMWHFRVPEGIEALKFSIVGAADEFSDGEAQVLAILPSKELVTEAQPFWMDANEEITIQRKITNQSSTAEPEKLTLEITKNPIWNALSSLPYLMEYPYACSEQTFSRIFANSLGLKMINDMPELKGVLEEIGKAKSPLSSMAQMQQLLVAETPWRNEAQTQEERMRQLARLMQYDSLLDRVNDDIDILNERQLGSGAFPWFSGGYANLYITNYVVQGLSKMENMGISLDEMNASGLVKRGQKYLTNELIKHYNKVLEGKSRTPIPYSHLDILYTLSLDAKFTFDPTQKESAQFIINKSDSIWLKLPLELKAKLAMVHLRFGAKEKAQMIFESLQETAIQDEEKGMFWKGMSGHSWYDRNLIAHNAVMELYYKMEAGAFEKQALFKWLIQQKRKTDWGNTRATTQAIYQLVTSDYAVSDGSGDLSIQIGNQTIATKDEGLFVNKEWEKESIPEATEPIKINNEQNSPKWGSIYYQYYEKADSVRRSGDRLQIERKLYVQRGSEFHAILDSTVLETGDRIRVELLVSSADDFDFVHIKDGRTAALEPTDVLSGYKSFGKLWAYQVNRDASMNFFVDRLPRGTYNIQYEMLVNQSGTYANGYANIQSMYAPEYSAKSAGQGLKIIPRY